MRIPREAPVKSLFPAGAKIDVTADSYEMAAAVALKWNIETTQLERGRYRFSIKAVHTPLIQVARSWRSLGTRLDGNVPQGTAVLAFALNPKAGLQFRGRKVESHDLIVQEDTRGLDFSFIGEIDILTIAVCREELDRRALAQWGKAFPCEGRRGILRFATQPNMRRAGHKIAGGLAGALGNPFPLSQAQAGLQFNNLILETVFDSLEDQSTALGSVDRHRAAKRAVDFLHGHCREDISMTDLCEAAKANRRTLHLGFLELYGIAPMKYLRALRLCGVRREIQNSRDKNIRVTDIAMAWGFNHLGRFSNYYKTFFGDLPSVQKTLKTLPEYEI